VHGANNPASQLAASRTDTRAKTWGATTHEQHAQSPMPSSRRPNLASNLATAIPSTARRIECWGEADSTGVRARGECEDIRYLTEMIGAGCGPLGDLNVIGELILAVSAIARALKGRGPYRGWSNTHQNYPAILAHSVQCATNPWVAKRSRRMSWLGARWCGSGIECADQMHIGIRIYQSAGMPERSIDKRETM
jgi:hypothetical protein